MKNRILYTLSIILLLSNQMIAEPIPYNFKYTSTDGSVKYLLVDNSTYIMVEFFATWCESCRFEMRTLNSLHSLLPDNIIMKQISISPDTDSLEKIIEFQQEFNAEWEFGVDKQDFVADMFDVGTIPTAILFSPDGYRLTVWIGITELSKYINDINVEVPNANIPVVEGEGNNIDFAVDTLVSNPLFVITSLVIILTPILLMILKRCKRVNGPV